MVINSPQYKLFEQSPVILTELTEHKMTTICIGYSIIETKEVTVLGITGFFFHMSTQVKAEVTNAEKDTRYIQYG